MGSDVHEHDSSFILPEYGAVVSGYVDALTTGKSFSNRVIVEDWMEWRIFEKVLSLDEFYAHVFWYFLKPFEKQPVKNNLHGFSN